VFERIAQDSTSSASVLTRRAADELAAAVESAAADNPGTFWERLLTICGALVDAQREMAPVINLVNGALKPAERAVLSGASVDAMRQLVVAECGRVSDAIETELEELGFEGVSVVPPSGRVATISSSEGVWAVLSAARERGAGFEVVVGESRPADEGVRFAARLSDAGIPATLVVDAALPGLIGQCQLVLTGADSVSEHDFVNKIGSYAMALAADEADVPFFVAAPRSKLLSEALRGTPDRLRDPSQVMEAAPPGVSVENRYFDTVPLALVRGIVTERGVLAPGDVATAIQETPVAPALMSLLFTRRTEPVS
jgi:ribose 1,5-bisphosphate isomerase